VAKMVAGELPERIALLNGDSERRAGARRRGVRRSAGGMRQEQGSAGLDAGGIDEAGISGKKLGPAGAFA
jgi:hypothetical protein